MDNKLYHDFLRDALREKFSGRSAPDVSAAVLKRLNSPGRQTGGNANGRASEDSSALAGWAVPSHNPWRTRTFALVAAALLVAVASVVIWFVAFNNAPTRTVDTAERKGAPVQPAPPKETPSVKDTPKAAPKTEQPKEVPKDVPTPETPPVVEPEPTPQPTPEPTPEKPPVVEPEPAPTPRNTVVEIPGAKKTEANGVVTLERGCVVLLSDAPAVTVVGAQIKQVTGRVAVNVGGVPADEVLKDVITVMAATPDPLTSEEKTMLMSRTSWLLKTGFALCVLSGAVMLDGSLIDAQRKPVPDQPPSEQAPLPEVPRQPEVEKPKEPQPEAPVQPPKKSEFELALTEDGKQVLAKAESLGRDERFYFLRAAASKYAQRQLVVDQNYTRSYSSFVGKADRGLVLLPDGATLGERDKTRHLPHSAYQYSFSTRLYGQWSPQVGFYMGELTAHCGALDGAAGLAPLKVAADVARESDCPEEFTRSYATKDEARRGLDQENEGSRYGGVIAQRGYSYVLRSIQIGGEDVLVAISVVGNDAGGITLAWRLVKRYSSPRKPNHPGTWGANALTEALLALELAEHQAIYNLAAQSLTHSINSLSVANADNNSGTAVLVGRGEIEQITGPIKNRFYEGCYYSFPRRTHDYQDAPTIEAYTRADVDTLENTCNFTAGFVWDGGAGDMGNSGAVARLRNTRFESAVAADCPPHLRAEYRGRGCLNKLKDAGSDYLKDMAVRDRENYMRDQRNRVGDVLAVRSIDVDGANAGHDDGEAGSVDGQKTARHDTLSVLVVTALDEFTVTVKWRIIKDFRKK
ncbi:MAG: hypothetical protein IT462_01950 [Planctomycetes bacterium]|nr:hypothetical protein [Planctomycetota bacterium]